MQKRKLKKVIVNSITSMRLLGTFLIIPIYLKFDWLVTSITAGIIFATDFVDGTLARRFHVQTFFGSVLDTVADKAFSIIILFILAFFNPIFIICIILELGIFVVNYTSIQNDNNVQSSKKGKVKTFILDFISVLSLVLIALEELDVVKYGLDIKYILSLITIPALIAQIITIKDYILTSLNNNKNPNKPKKERLKTRKTAKEIFFVLFDTDYYLNHKADRLKSLLYK